MATKKNLGIGAAVVAAGAATAIAASKKHRKAESKNTGKTAGAQGERQEYRNTERGKGEKNSKGIY